MYYLASAGTVIIISIAVIACLIAAFYITRMMKGKIEVQLAKTGYNSGEPLTGMVTLTTKKTLELRRLYVALIGYRVMEHREEDGALKTRRDEIYRNEFNLLEGQTIPGGSQKTFDFSLVTPGGNSPAGGASGGDVGHSEIQRKIVSTVGTAVQTLVALGILGSGSTRLEWKVEARADLPGVDLAKSKNVRINMM